MKKILIAAVADNGCIGKNGKLPWHFKEDMQFFKQTTTGHAIIMGSKTFRSLHKPLPNRDNIVLTRKIDSLSEKRGRYILVRDLDTAFRAAEGYFNKNAFIIGGAKIYKLGLPYVDELLITRIPGEYDGDTYFPEWPLKEWKIGASVSISGRLHVDYYFRR